MLDRSFLILAAKASNICQKAVRWEGLSCEDWAPNLLIQGMTDCSSELPTGGLARQKVVQRLLALLKRVALKIWQNELKNHYRMVDDYRCIYSYRSIFGSCTVMGVGTVPNVIPFRCCSTSLHFALHRCLQLIELSMPLRLRAYHKGVPEEV